MRWKAVVGALALLWIAGCGGGGGGGGGGAPSLMPAALEQIFDRFTVAGILRRQAAQPRFTRTYEALQAIRWSSTTLGVPDKVPVERCDIRRIGAAYAYLSAAAIAEFTANFPEGAGPNAFRVNATPNPVMKAGMYCFYWMMLDAAFPLTTTNRYFQYAAVFDPDSSSSNNYVPSPPFDLDFFMGTQLWWELTKALTGPWTLTAKDATDSVVTPLQTLAAVLILANVACFMIPMCEMCDSNYPPKFRMTAFEHGGDYGLNEPHDWSGCDRPDREDLLAHVDTSAILREGPRVQLDVEFLTVRPNWLADLTVPIAKIGSYAPRDETDFPVRNGLDQYTMWDSTLFGGRTDAFQMLPADLLRRLYASEVTHLTDAFAPDYGFFLQTPGLRWFSPDDDDLRVFTVPPTLDYGVTPLEDGTTESGELHGAVGDADFHSLLQGSADSGPNTSGYAAPTLTLNHGQVGAVMLADRTADRTNVEVPLLNLVDAHFMPPVQSFTTGPTISPAVHLANGGSAPSTESVEQYLGRPWQRWSRHFQPGQWRSGVDGLESYVALIRQELIHSLPSLGLRLHRAHGGSGEIASRDVVEELVRTSAAAEPGLKASVRFLLGEWEHIIDAWQLDSWEAYRDVPRLGRKTRLPEAQRRAAWSVFERVKSALKARGLLTEAGLFTALARMLESSGKVLFDYAVVDEAQDLGVPHLRFFAALGGSRPNALFFSGDLGQRIFQQPFSWKSLGVDVRGRSRTLRVNYRTTHQIRAQADRLLGTSVADVDGNVEDRRGTVSVFNGPSPIVRTFDTEQDETAAVGSWLRECSQSGVAPHEIGVFVRSEDQVGRATAALQGAGLPGRVLDDRVETKPGETSVCTMHRAKGLEFRAVAVMACDDEVLPLQQRVEAVGDTGDLEDVYETERHLLYVACTRARDRLLVTGVEPASEFLEDLTGARAGQPRRPEAKSPGSTRASK